MIGMRIKIFGYLLASVLIFAAAIPVLAINLISEYRIPLKENDRILGSLKGNFLIYGRPQITMYNVRGKSVFSKKLTNNIKPTLSPNGKYLGLITYADHSPTDLHTTQFAMYDQAGKLQWKMSKPTPNTFLIANNGAIFGVEGVEGIPPTRIHLFDQYGNLRNMLTFQDYHGLQVSPSGGKIIIDRARQGLEVYDSLGKALGSLPVSHTYIFDRDDRYIATFFEGVFHLFQDEREVATIRSPETVIKAMAVNVEQNRLILMAPKHLEAYELTTQKLLWEYKVMESSRALTSLDLSADGQFITCGVDVNGGTLVVKDKRHVEGYVLLFTGEGQLVARQRTTYKLWAGGLPKAVFPGSSGSIIMQTREFLEKFKIK